MHSGMQDLYFSAACLGRRCRWVYPRRRARPLHLMWRLPARLHHNAYVVRDHEVNRRFFEIL